MSRLRFATLDMTTSYFYPVLAHEPIGAAPIKVLDMTGLSFYSFSCHFEQSPDRKACRDAVEKSPASPATDSY